VGAEGRHQDRLHARDRRRRDAHLDQQAAVAVADRQRIDPALVPGCGTYPCNRSPLRRWPPRPPPTAAAGRARGAAAAPPPPGPRA
jgi:hypothetical protein